MTPYLSDQLRDDHGANVRMSVDAPTLREPCGWRSQAGHLLFSSRRIGFVCSDGSAPSQGPVRPEPKAHEARR